MSDETPVEHTTAAQNVQAMTKSEAGIYEVVKDNLGLHLTLNDTIPQDKGCAECLSKILSLAGISVPRNGIAGTSALLAWLISNPDFIEVPTAEQGAVIISATGSGNNSIEGHVGIICAFDLMYKNDFGIASNDSNTGTLREQWSLAKWLAYYEVAGGMRARYFRAL